MSTGFTHLKTINNERIERDANGNTLKKYNGTGTSWPTLTKVQTWGQSHNSQQDELMKAPKRITDFMKNF